MHCVTILTFALFLSSCSGRVTDEVRRGFFVLYEKKPAVGAGQIILWDREEDGSNIQFGYGRSAETSAPRLVSDVSLMEPLKTGWFSSDGKYFHGLSASGRMYTINSARGELESEVNLGLSNPVEAVFWKDRSLVFVARFSPPQVALLSFEDFSHLGTYDLPGRPGRLVLDEANERLFVSIPEKDRVVALGVDPLREVVSLELPAGSKPMGMLVGASGRLYITRPGLGSITRIALNLTSREDLPVSGTPEAVSAGSTKKGARVVLANPAHHGFQILSTDPLELEVELPVESTSEPFELLASPDSHFTLFLSRNPAELGWIDHWNSRIAAVVSLTDNPVAVLIQPPRPPDHSNF